LQAPLFADASVTIKTQSKSAMFPDFPEVKRRWLEQLLSATAARLPHVQEVAQPNGLRHLC
jgi:hypothetical protein